MLAEIITIGDELLIGQVVDTNSAWMAQKLNAAGIRVKQISSVSDDAGAILKALDEATGRAEIVLITGGLGPTKDDITKTTLCSYFKVSLRFDEGAYNNVLNVFKTRGVQVVSELNRKQAEVPGNCVVLPNPIGTAPGMWFDHMNKVYVSMPGVPYEMMAMIENEVIPRLKERFQLPAIVHKTMLTQGVGESVLSEMIATWEDRLPSHMKLAYLPSPGAVRLRLTALGLDRKTLEEEVDHELALVIPLIQQYLYGFDNDTLESIAGKLLKEQGKTLATAESCTGGYIAHLLTSVAGSSAYFQGSLVTYSNASKEKLLGVSHQVLQEKGAVSEAVVREMAAGAKDRLQTDYVIACTGIAGPDGGSEDKPVGTVWIALATPEKVIAEKFLFGNNRERNIRRTALTALNMLIKDLKSGK